MEMEEFERLVSEALTAIPDFFKNKLDNVDIVIEDWPSPQQARGMMLLGLYQGVPKTARGAGYNLVLPDKIAIFKRPIEIVSRENSGVIKEIVTDTVEHEIAHHFGISEARLRELKK